MQQDLPATARFLIGGELPVCRLGFGTMRLTGPGSFGWPEDREEAQRLLRELPALGIDLIDTADAYGPDIADHQLRAALLLFFAPPILTLSAYLVPEIRLYAAAAASLSLLLGWRIRSRVQARQHGQEIEATFSSRAIPELEKAGFHVESGRMTRIGDVDLVVRRAGWCATILSCS